MTTHPYRSLAVLAVMLSAAFALAAVSSAGSSSATQRGGGADCADFSSQAAAQNYFNSHPGDPAGLDADNDGIACETNPCPCSTGGGGGGGGGGGAPPPPAPKPIKTDRLCGHILGATGSRVCLKAVTQGDKLKRVEDFKFRGLPVRCGPPPKRKVTGKESRIDGDGRKFASQRVQLRGSPSDLRARAAGKVKGNGKAEGELRVRFTDAAGTPCDSRLRRWKAG